MDVTENYPSLINCLETGQNGLFLDLSAPSGGQTDAVGTISCIGPFSKTIPGCIKTDGGGVVKQVLLVLQRDHYDAPGSLLPLNNRVVETAWQNAFAFYRNCPTEKVPIFFKHQVNPKGDFEPLQPLFHCRETGCWFHPVCPQCGLALTLCRDDALLEKRGLPTYSESLERFLYCGSCAALSDSSPFFCREKAAGMPDHVHDAAALVTQWNQLLAKFPDDTDLPCRGCPDRDACYGPDSLVSGRIVPYRFFPFYMIMVPAPSCLAAEFIALISGDTATGPLDSNAAGSPPVPNRFLFQDQDRQFLEILYLKLTFLAQVCRQIIPAENAATIQEFDLSLEGLGVDLNPPGVGLPAYWNFNVRILDAVGTFQVSPFAPRLPEAPRLHFLGAVWFRALLVNSRQPADTVFAEVGRLLRQIDIEKKVKSLEIDVSAPMGVFAGSQIFWMPDQRNLAEQWQGYWKQAMRMGFELVHAGLTTGVAWDQDQFSSALDALRNQIRDEMFSGPAIAPAGEEKTAASDKISMVLHSILQKWQEPSALDDSQPILAVEPEHPDIDETIILSSAQGKPAYPPDNGMPPEGTDWDGDIQETVIFSSAGQEPPTESTLGGVADPQPQESQWNDDIQQTIVLQNGSTPPSPKTVSPEDDMDRTVIISAASMPPDASPPGKEEDLAATMIEPSPRQATGNLHRKDEKRFAVRSHSPPQAAGNASTIAVQNAPGQPPSPSGGFDEDLEATVVLNAGGPPVAKKGPLPGDDDLETTIIEPSPRQAAGNLHRKDESLFPVRSLTPPQAAKNALASAVQGGASRQPAPSHGSGSAGPPASDRPSNGDDLDATLIITPAGQHAPVNHRPEIPPGSVDDELDATLVETPRNVNRPHTEPLLTTVLPSTPPVPPQPPRADPKSGPGDDSPSGAPDQANDDDDIMEQTIIIRSDVKKE